MRTTIYLHSSKDSNYDLGIKLGLNGEALKMFLYALTEVCCGVEVDMKTGLARIVSVDGREVLDREPIAAADAAETFAQNCAKRRREQ